MHCRWSSALWTASGKLENTFSCFFVLFAQKVWKSTKKYFPVFLMCIIPVIISHREVSTFSVQYWWLFPPKKAMGYFCRWIPAQPYSRSSSRTCLISYESSNQKYQSWWELLPSILIWDQYQFITDALWQSYHISLSISNWLCPEH